MWRHCSCGHLDPRPGASRRWSRSPETAVSGPARFDADRQDVAPLACLVTLLLFARSGLYGDRARSGRASRVIVGSLFQVTRGRRSSTRVVEDYQFSSGYIFYGTLVFALFYVCSFRWVFERI